MWKKILIYTLSVSMIIPFSFLFSAKAEAKCTYVSGYYRSGKWVNGYSRGCGSSSSSNTSDSTTSRNLPTTSSIINLYKGSNYAGSADTDELVFIQGYYQKDGTYVRPHFRTHRNNFLTDNFSYEGLSTLKPLQKPNFSLNEDPARASIERYLYTTLAEPNLSDSQVKLLKEYADLLYIIQNDSSKLHQAQDTGSKFYQSNKFSSEVAAKQSNFDFTATLTIKDYIYQLLIQIGKRQLTLTQIQLIDRYSEMLTNFRNGKENSYEVTSIGETLYQEVGLDWYTAYSLAKMDLLQQDASLFKEEKNKETIKPLSPVDQKITLWLERPQIQIEENGQTRHVTLDTTPVIIKDRTMIPVRGLMDALGATVSWIPDGAKVLVEKDGMQIMLQLNSNLATLNGKVVTLDVPVQIRNDRTLIPVAFISSSLGYQVDWFESEKKVVVKVNK